MRLAKFPDMKRLISGTTELWSTLKRAAERWEDDEAMRLGAALSFYAAFSLGPLLMLAVGIASLVFGGDAAQGEMARQLKELVGSEGAAAVQALVAAAKRERHGVLATVVGGVVLLMTASGVFAELQSALNKIWCAEVKAKLPGWKRYLRTRLLSFAMVLVLGFLMLVSLVISTFLSLLGTLFSSRLAIPADLFEALNSAVSIVVIAGLFTLIFKFLPDARVRWSDAWPGALLTSLLFTLGKFAIGLYLGKSAVTSSFGASASLALILLWTYYSSLILFFGAEFSKAYSEVRQPAYRPPSRHPELLVPRPI